MNAKQYLFLFLISLIPLIFYLQKPFLVGVDSYYFLNSVCQNTQANAPILSQTIIQFIPCNTTTIKIMLWFLMLSSSIILALTGETINKKHGWLAGYFIYGSSYFITEFLKFEDDQIAFPILFLALYFYVKSLTTNTKKRSYQALSLGLAGLGGLIWKGSILNFIGFGLTMTWLPAFLITLIIVGFLFNNLIGAIIPNFLIQENVPAGILGIGIFLPELLLLGYLKKPNELKSLLVFWTVIVFLNAKFLIHLLGVLSVSFVDYYVKAGAYLRKFLLVCTFLVIVLSCLQIQGIAPNEKHWKAIDFAEQLSLETGKPLKNEFTFGYWMQFKGLKPTAFGGLGATQDYSDSVVLSSIPLNCVKRMEFVFEC